MFDEAYALLKKGDKKVENSDAKYRERIKFVRAGLDHTKWMIEIRSLMKRFKESEGTDAEAERKLLANWDKIQKNCEAFPLAVNWRPIRPGTPRMRGLHPNHLKNKGKKK